MAKPGLRLRMDLTPEQVKAFHDTCGAWLARQRKARLSAAKAIAREALEQARRHDDPDLSSV